MQYIEMQYKLKQCNANAKQTNAQSVEYPYTSPRVNPGHTVVCNVYFSSNAHIDHRHTVSWAQGRKEGGTSLQVQHRLDALVLKRFSWF